MTAHPRALGRWTLLLLGGGALVTLALRAWVTREFRRVCWAERGT